MSVRSSLSHLPAFVLAGAGTLLLLIWLAYRWSWLSPPNLFVLALLTGAGIGLLSWLGFEIGRLRWRARIRARTSSGEDQRGAYLRSFALSLLGFLVLGALYGLVLTAPVAVGQSRSSGTGIDMALLTVVGNVVIYGSPAVVPLVNGLLTGARAKPNAGRATIGGLVLGVGGSLAFLLPTVLLILLIRPSCAETEPPSCGYFYFGPSFWVKILSLLVTGGGLLVGFSSGVAAGLGVLVARLMDRRLSRALPVRA